MSTHSDLPPGYQPLALRPSGYLAANGPFFVRRDADGVAIGMRMESRHCNSAGLAHGGMLLTLVDLILTVGSNIVAQTSRFLPTINVSCDFIGPAHAEEWVEGRIDVLRVTRQHVFSEVLLRTGSGRLVARASGLLLIRGEPDPAYHADTYFRQS